MGDFQANFLRPDTGINTVEGNVAGSRAAGLSKKRAAEQVRRYSQLFTTTNIYHHLIFYFDLTYDITIHNLLIIYIMISIANIRRT